MHRINWSILYQHIRRFYEPQQSVLRRELVVDDGDISSIH